MNPPNSPPAMNQKIFSMGFSVETVSVYLLCCSLADTDTVISTNTLGEIFNGSPEVLSLSLKELSVWRIITKIISDQHGMDIYQLNDIAKWKTAG
jgi:hypothetical protein